MGPDEALTRFRAALNEFKRPFLERLEEEAAAGGAVEMDDDEAPMTEVELQATARVQDVLDKLDALYDILEAAIRNDGTNRHPDLDAKAVCSVFEKNGVFTALREHPELKEKMLEALKVDIRMYPFTLNPGLINAFQANDVPAYQRDDIEAE